MPNWKKIILSGSTANLNSLTVTNGITGSLQGTASLVSSIANLISNNTNDYILTSQGGDSINGEANLTFNGSTLNVLGNTIISGSLAVGTGSLGASENTITLGARDSANEGGQIGFNAPGGTYTSASFIDNWQNKARILKGNNTTSTGLLAQWDIHTRQLQLPGYTNDSSFVGTATANLAVDSGGNVITVSTSGGSVFPYTGNAVITGSLTATAGFIAPNTNGAMYLRGGDDVELWDINISNHLGVYGQQDQGVASLKLGSGGGILSGRSGSIGIGTINPTSASLTVNGNVWATSFTGSLYGTASWAVSASYALTSSYAINPVISGSISNVDYIDFNESAGVTVQPGQLAWNSSDGTLDLGLKGGNVTLQIGQETLYEVRNATGVTISNGTSLYASGVTSGSGRIEASPFTSDGSVRDINFLGLATEDIGIGVNGFVTHFGYTRGLDTRGTAPSSIAVGDENWSVGDILYAHPTVAGKLTNVKPKHEISVAIIINRHQTTGVLFVRPTSFGHLFDNHDVNINTGSLSTGDLLIYNSGSDYWINSKQLTGSYAITGSLTATTFIGSLNGNATTATSATTASLVNGNVNVTTATIGNTVYATIGTTAGAGTTSIYSVPNSTYSSIFVDYAINEGTTNARAGTIQVISVGSNLNFTETTTMDIGNTNDISWYIYLSGADINFEIINAAGASWTIKFSSRQM